MPHFDVAIIGAGPAGCWAARQLAERGARVALVDGSHPREKPCGGGVTARALALVQDVVDLPRANAVAIGTATFAQGSRSVTIAMTPAASPAPPRLAVMSRRAFDSALLAAAERAGARLVPARATGVRRAGGGWAVSTRRGEIAADWLLGADGPNSLVRRSVSVPFGRADLSIATGYYVHGITSHDIGIVFENDPPGYLWSFPRADHLAVGVCAQADEASTARLLAIAKRWIESTSATRDARLERYSWPIPSLRAGTLRHERPAGPRWLLLGDAAGMVDPITREGIYFALRSGETAARCLLGGGSASSRYEREMRATILSELARAARLKARFFQPRFTALLITALERSHRIAAVMADLVAGEQAYHGLRRRLLATLQVGLMVELFRTTALDSGSAEPEGLR